VAPAGTAARIANDGTARLTVLVVVTPRPPRVRGGVPRVAEVTCLGDHVLSGGRVRIVRLLRRLGVTSISRRADLLRAAALHPAIMRGGGGRATHGCRCPRRRARVVPSGSCAWMVKHEYPG